MAKIAYGTCKLYARGKVLKQWFTILNQTSLYFKKFEEELVNNIISKVEKVVKKSKKILFTFQIKKVLIMKKDLD